MPGLFGSATRTRTRRIDLGFAAVAAVFVALAVAGALRSFSPVPHWDMWDGYLGFYTKLAGGDTGAWWAQHNEHRILLTRLFFWLDLTLFQGRGVLLIVVNYLLVACTCALFVQMARARGGPSTRWLAGFLVAWLFLWIQQNNLTWGFQIQFILAQLLPLCGFLAVHRAARGEPGAFGWALAFGVLSIGTMANGVLALPLMTVQALISGLDRRRCTVLALASVACVALYFHDYAAPGGHGSLGRTLLETPWELLRFTLLYLGSPFGLLAGNLRRGIPLGIATGAVLIAASVVAALRLLPARREETLRVALVAFLVYIGGTAFGTAGGRTAFGIEQALSSRYTTPALMAWAALLLLWLPRGGPRTPRGRRALVAGCSVLLLPMAEVQVAALKPRHPAAFERAIGALALELGVRDPARIGRIFPDADWALAIAATPRERHWSVFGLAPYRDAHRAIGHPAVTPAQPGHPCRGGIEDTEAIEGEPGYLRVRGWLVDVAAGTAPASGTLVDARGVVRGVVLTGDRSPDSADPSGPARAGFVGYVQADALGTPLAVVDPVGGCATDAKAPHLLYRSRTPADPAAVTVGADRIATPGDWTGGGGPGPLPGALRALGSSANGDADTGSVVLQVMPGERLLYRSGPTAGRQFVELVDTPGRRSTLPAATDWVMLEFAFEWGDTARAVRFIDSGDRWGDWSAIAVAPR